MLELSDSSEERNLMQASGCGINVKLTWSNISFPLAEFSSCVHLN